MVQFTTGHSEIDKRLDRCRTDCGADPLVCVPDEETVSHFGMAESDPEFRNGPIKDQPGMSMQRGHLEPIELMQLVVSIWVDSRGEDALARYTTAGRLRQAGFIVAHSPAVRSPGHVTVAVPDATGGRILQAPWPIEVQRRLETCFTDVKKEGQQ